MNLEQSLDLAIVIYTQYESSTWEALETAMYATKMPKRHAERILEFMPIAFGRILMRESGVEFQPTYERRKPDSAKRKEYAFAKNAAYIASLEYAERQNQSVTGLPTLNAVAVRSPEIKAIEDMVNSGVETQNIVLSKPILGWTSIPENPDEKIWWQVWK
jgi:hypothetical protein